MALPMAGIGGVQGVEGPAHFSIPSGMTTVVGLRESGVGGGRLLGVMADGGVVAWDCHT